MRQAPRPKAADLAEARSAKAGEPRNPSGYPSLMSGPPRAKPEERAVARSAKRAQARTIRETGVEAKRIIHARAPEVRGRRPRIAPKREARRRTRMEAQDLSNPNDRPKLTGNQNRTGNPRVRPARSRSGKLDWQALRAKSASAADPESPGVAKAAREKRKWVPKAEYKKSLGIEAKKDKNWRPGGEHKDPRQKYKDAKKAKWGRFKQTVRKRWEAKGKKDDK